LLTANERPFDVAAGERQARKPVRAGNVIAAMLLPSKRNVNERSLYQ
jgi:hypothetical protein